MVSTVRVDSITDAHPRHIKNVSLEMSMRTAPKEIHHELFFMCQGYSWGSRV